MWGGKSLRLEAGLSANTHLQGVLERTDESKDIAASQVYLNACMMFQAEGPSYNTK